MALDAATWYATPSAQGTRLSFAGAWYCFVSLPMAQFLLVRWYFRVFLWALLPILRRYLVSLEIYRL
jgi:hypothetical protein